MRRVAEKREGRAAVELARYMRLEAAAVQYGTPLRWLRTACLTGKVKASKVGRRWYVAPRDMEAVFERGRNIDEYYGAVQGRKERVG